MTGCLLVATLLAVVAASCDRVEDRNDFRLRGEVPSERAPFALALYESLGVTLRPGRELALVGNDAIFDRIEDDIRRGRGSVHVLLFIYVLVEVGAADVVDEDATRDSSRAFGDRPDGSPRQASAQPPQGRRDRRGRRVHRRLRHPRRVARRRRHRGRLARCERALHGTGRGRGPAGARRELARGQRHALPAGCLPASGDVGPGGRCVRHEHGLPGADARRAPLPARDPVREEVPLDRKCLLRPAGHDPRDAEGQGSAGVDVRLLVPGEKSDSKLSRDPSTWSTARSSSTASASSSTSPR